MNAKFTPGPWQVNRKYKMSVEACSDGQGINIIAECSDPDGERTAGEDMANARLIAAAPEMFALLEECEKHMIISTQADMIRLDQIRAAIAKARGES